MNEKHLRLWLAIRLPHLPLDALKIADAHIKPIVVIEKKKIVYANDVAASAGACIGMDGTTAQLLTDSLAVERDQAKELSMLSELSEQFYQFTPYIERHVSSGSAESALLLEISSCLKLFLGVKAMTQKIAEFLEKAGHQFSFGLAHSEQAAWFLSFADYIINGSEDKKLFLERLNNLPIELLFDHPKILDSLSKTGFKNFSDLAVQISKKSFSIFRKRYGHEFTEMLCDMYGVNHGSRSLFEKPRDIYKPKEWFEEEVQFEYPVTLVDQLKPAIEVLLQKLSDYLRKRQWECQYIEWVISDIYHNKDQIKVNSDILQSHWELLYDLSLIQFEVKELPFEVDTIKLVCQQALVMKRQSNVLDFDRNHRRRDSVQDFATVIAKLKARLGDAAVYKLSYQDSRIPELTNAIISLAEKSNQNLPDVYKKSLYPAWLLSKPEVMEERNHRLFWHGYVAPLVGPERIIGDWWDAPVARDYYLALRHDHLRLWIFFNLYDKRWYVHGVFA